MDTFNVWLAQNQGFMLREQSKAGHELDYSLGINKIQNEKGVLGTLYDLATDVTSDFVNGGQMRSLATGGMVTYNAVEESDVLALDKKRAQTQFDDLLADQLAQSQYHEMLPNTVHFGSNNATLLGYR